MTERDLTPGHGGAAASGSSRFQESQEPHSENPREAGSSQSSAAGLGQKISDDIASLRQTAKDELSGAADKANDVAIEQKNVIASKVGGIAAAMEKVAAELEQGDQRDIGRLTRNIGSSMRTFSDDIKDRDIGEIAQMAEDFGRKQPLAFLGMAAIAGLAASRFLTASSIRGSRSGMHGAEQRSPQTPDGASATRHDTNVTPSTEDHFNG
ncbi:nutrient deprivation-induced protein [Rhizobium sp. XQZ8]|uniref:nutrient deprivation-induced protein n=1 Tax=Rhizobium populisoli TaxID=2859785 RepID=UPI001CA473E6|nr:nutrient deprivation-induced protein [Rhizobium populisoli]MBW6425410.1 nutrient deprivation-induced protein [Rhizobium populisoli]